MRKQPILVIVFVLVLLAGAYLFFFKHEPKNTETLILYGNVDIRDVSLGFRVGGKIAELYCEEGDTIEVNQPLAKLDAVPLYQELNLRKAEVDEAEAILHNAMKSFERNKELLNTGAVSQGVYDETLARKDEALARLATSKARLAISKINVDDTELRSPSTGIILTRIREVGSIVSEGMPIYTLMLNDPVWVRTYVNETELGYIFPGQQATIMTDSGGEYTGQVGFISPQAEFTPKSVETTTLRTDLVYRLRVIVKNSDQGLRQGMPVTVQLKKKK